VSRTGPLDSSGPADDSAGASSPITAAIVNYNGARYLKDCIVSVRSQSLACSEILVVDNASSDGSADLAAAEGLRVLRLPVNGGAGSARNAALAAASTPLVLLVDNDVLLERDCLEALAGAFRSREGTRVCQARTIYDTRRDLVQCDGGYLHFLGAMIPLNGHRTVHEVGRETREVDSVITTAVLVDRASALAIGGFDEDFFVYFEDHDFALRTRIAGGLCLGVGSAVAYHRGGTAELSFRPGGPYTARRFFLQCRNRWLVVLKAYPLRTLLVLLPAFALFEMLSFVYALRRGFAGEFLRALGWVLGHAGEIRHKRAGIRALARVDVRRLMRGGPYPYHPSLLSSRAQRRLAGALDAVLGLHWTMVRRIL
jgi:GT2 family glycosyltransferase